MNIGLCGAPLSGKTTLGAMIYAEMLKQGIEGTYLISEYAKTHLAKGLGIKSIHDQFAISNRQRQQELEIRSTSFDPIISDSCLWLGKIYLELGAEQGLDLNEPYVPILMHDFETCTYDCTIYVPLQDITGGTSEFRVHDGVQAAKIAYMIEQELATKKNVIYAPIDYKERDEWVKEFVMYWKNELLLQENERREKEMDNVRGSTEPSKCAVS